MEQFHQWGEELFRRQQVNLDRRVLNFFWKTELVGVAGSLMSHFFLDPYDQPYRFWLMLSTLALPAGVSIWKHLRPRDDLRYPIALAILVAAIAFNYANRLPEFFSVFYLVLLGVALYQDTRLYLVACVLTFASMLAVNRILPVYVVLPRDSGLANQVVRWVVYLLFCFVLFHIVRMVASKEREAFRHTYRDMVQAFARAVEVKDNYTRGHADRTTAYALILGAEMQRQGRLGADDLEILHIAGLLHDIGKIGVPDHVLLKPGRLEAGEYEQVKEHPVLGAAILSGLPLLGPVLPIIRHHHERYDGKGYPDGLAGKEIPFLAQVLAVADAFDAMTSHRIYRAALPLRHAWREITGGSGVQFDPEVVAAFERAYPSLVAKLTGGTKKHRVKAQLEAAVGKQV